jgi:anti-sigma factor RsiW
MSSPSEKHVAHLLAAYLENQLSQRRMQQVRRHVAGCPACRARLSQHEQLVGDLRLTLAAGLNPRPAATALWWQAVQKKRFAPRSFLSRSASFVLPALIAALIILAPFTASLNNSSALVLPDPQAPTPVASLFLDEAATQADTALPAAPATAAATPAWRTTPALTVPPTPGVNP